MKRNLRVGAAFLALIAALGFGSRVLGKKGGAAATFEALKSSPGLEDLWQLHDAVDATDHHMPEQFIANQGTGGTAATGVPDEGAVNYIQTTTRSDGSFSVKNSRSGFQKDSAAKP